MENICIIGADALTQFITLKLNNLYPYIKIYVAPGNGVTDLCPNVINLSTDLSLSDKSIKLLKYYQVSHIVLLDEELLLKGGIEFFKSYGFTTQVGSTKSAYLSQKVSQQRLWAQRFEIETWPHEICYSTDKAHSTCSEQSNLQIITEGGQFSIEIPVDKISNIKMQSIAFSTLIVQKAPPPSQTITQIYDKVENKIVRQFQHLPDNSFKMADITAKTQPTIKKLLKNISKMEFIYNRYFALTFVIDGENKYLLEYQPLLQSRFFPALMAINWEKSDIFYENLKFNRKSSKIIKMTKLTNFDNLEQNNYSLKDHWEHAKDTIFQNYSARYIDGQILAKKPFYGYLVENTN